MSKHTLGPWTARLVSEDYVIFHENNDGERAVIAAWWCTHDVPAEQMRANARLIAAAPKMLRTLIAVRRVFEQHPEDWDEGADEFCINELDAAIEAAGGEDE